MMNKADVEKYLERFNAIEKTIDQINQKIEKISKKSKDEK